MTNKLKYFIGNWKMFGDFSSYKILYRINQFISSNRRLNKVKIILCVPNTLIHFYNKKLKSKSIYLGVQNCHTHEGYGPYTGSVNASMLKKVGAKYIILGHSENRLEGDTNKQIKRKILSSLNQKLNIIFCIGETYREKRNGKTFSILRKQMKETLEKNFNINKILFAYEPVWSIGTNRIPEINELRKTIRFIKDELRKNFNKKIVPKILYGGSVNPKNISLFSSIADIDGFLIGGASQSSKKFIDIIKNYYK